MPDQTESDREEEPGDEADEGGDEQPEDAGTGGSDPAGESLGSIPRDSAISIIDNKVKQEVTVRLQNVERGHLEMELECVPLTQ